MGRRGISVIASTILLVVVALVAVLLLYSWTSGAAGRAGFEPGSPPAGGRPVIDAVRVGPGFVEVVAHCVGGGCAVSSVSIVDPKTGTAIAHYAPGRPLELGSRPSSVVAPLLALQAPGGLPPVRALVTISTTTGLEARAWASLRGAGGSSSTWLGLLAARDVSCSKGDLDVNPSLIHWVYFNLVTGDYRFRYINGATVRDASGKALVFTDSNVLNLSAMSREERYALGPVVVFINPTRASSDYRVTVYTIYNARIVLDMPPLPGAPDSVAVDALALWEDLWWPGTSASLDNYVDHVVRFTVFVNGTVRVEIVRASGCYLHMLLYRSGGLPPFDSVPGIVEEYQASGHRLPASSGVLYVKSHGAWAPSADMSNTIWDPVDGVWLNSWPIVFTINP